MEPSDPYNSSQRQNNQFQLSANLLKVFGFAAYSDNGKTTLIENLLPLLVARGLKVSVVKHAHHGFDIDQPGKDSYRHRKAGASEVLISSDVRWALMHELRGESGPRLASLLQTLTPCDLVLVDGFKKEPIPKMEVHRAAAGTPLLFPDDPNIVAMASDATIKTSLPCYRLDDHAAISGFLLKHLGMG
jgi:molybdopterin-guanine dinucleotide biosynthesis protein B